MINEDFEWDDDKAASNLLKHRVSFDEAADAFDDENAVEIDDPGNYGERRITDRRK
jgi:uncharacterized protein